MAGVRVDASALEVKDQITASITSTTNATSIPLGGGSDGGGVAGVVGEVAAGIKVTADQRRQIWLVQPRSRRLPLRLPKAIVGAWGPTNLTMDEDGGPENMQRNLQTASLRIVLDNLPDDAKVEWPSPVSSTIDIAASGAPDGPGQQNYRNVDPEHS